MALLHVCRVQAGNSEGLGDFSSESACSTAKPPPPAPTSVIAFVAAEHAGAYSMFVRKQTHCCFYLDPSGPWQVCHVAEAAGIEPP